MVTATVGSYDLVLTCQMIQQFASLAVYEPAEGTFKGMATEV